MLTVLTHPSISTCIWGCVIDFACDASEWAEELLQCIGKSPIDLYLQSNPGKTETFQSSANFLLEAVVIIIRWGLHLSILS